MVGCFKANKEAEIIFTWARYNLLSSGVRDSNKRLITNCNPYGLKCCRTSRRRPSDRVDGLFQFRYTRNLSGVRFKTAAASNTSAAEKNQLGTSLSIDSIVYLKSNICSYNLLIDKHINIFRSYDIFQHMNIPRIFARSRKVRLSKMRQEWQSQSPITYFSSFL